jgi:hypothetical protein
VFVVDKFGLHHRAEEAVDGGVQDAGRDARPMRTRCARACAREHGRGAGGSAAPLRFRNKVMKACAVNGRSAGYDLVDDLTIERGRHLSSSTTRARPVASSGPRSPRSCSARSIRSGA